MQTKIKITIMDHENKHQIGKYTLHEEISTQTDLAECFKRMAYVLGFTYIEEVEFTKQGE